jgi:hypothetical protein
MTGQRRGWRMKHIIRAHKHIHDAQGVILLIQAGCVLTLIVTGTTWMAYPSILLTVPSYIIGLAQKALDEHET